VLADLADVLADLVGVILKLAYELCDLGAKVAEFARVLPALVALASAGYFGVGFGFVSTVTVPPLAIQRKLSISVVESQA